MKLQHLIPALCMAASITLTPTVSQATLLELTTEQPTITFTAVGMIDYNAATSTVLISSSPSSIFSINHLINANITGTNIDDTKDITITFQADTNGTVIPNDINVPDLVVNGSIDTDGDGIADLSGVLLTAEVSQFGFSDGGTGGNDLFDLRLNNISGLLAYMYTGSDLAVDIQSENTAEYTTPFAGSFNANWTGQAKGSINSTTPASSGENDSCNLKLASKCSVNGGPFKDKCRIKVTRSVNHWEQHDISYNAHAFQMSKYGMHEYTVPTWAANYPTTEVTFKYTVTNIGSTPVANILIEDSFDTAVTGYPTSLAVDDSFSTTRLVDLSESIENNVIVLGSNNSEICVANDVIVIKDKLRDRKKHDDDDFKDKGNH